MTSRYQSLTVTFDEPIREDDLETWIRAIYLLDKVVDVEPESIDNLAKHQAKRELRKELQDLLSE